MATFLKIDAGAGLQELLRKLEGDFFDVDLVEQATKLSRREVQRIYASNIRKAIRQAGIRRRTGALNAVKFVPDPQEFVAWASVAYDMLPTFPRTRYRTPRGRGRPGASKQGQYAFVLNDGARKGRGGSPDFIGAAAAATARDPRVPKAIAKQIARFINRSR